MANARQIYQFGPFSLDSSSRVLLRGDDAVPIAPKVLETLLILVRNSGNIIEKDKLHKELWDGVEMDENNLAQHISLLRKTLGDNCDQTNKYKYVETVPRRGYRFVGAVQEPFRSIAILPFKSLPLDKDDEILGLGLADVLITKLAAVKRISVRPTSSVMKYNNLHQDSLSAGRELRVDSVLEGKFHRVGDRIRATVQLLRVRDGEQLWSGIFDENFTNIFAVEDSISNQVMQALMIKLSGDDKKKLAKQHTTNSEAHQLYLKGRYYLTKRSAEGVLKGVECFRKAIELDAGFDLAYSGLADCYALSSSYAGRPPSECYPKAKIAALKALQLNDELAEAHASLGLIALDYEWQWDAAEKNLTRAIELNPNLLDARQWYAMLLLSLGRKQEALWQMKQAHEIDPVSIVVNGNLALLYYFMNDFDQALEEIEKTIELEANFVLAHLIKGQITAKRGNLQEAEQIFSSVVQMTGKRFHFALALWAYILGLQGKRSQVESLILELEEDKKTLYVSPLAIAVAHLGIGKMDLVHSWLERAFDDRSWGMVHLPVEPIFDPIRADEKFNKLLSKMGLLLS